MSDPLKPASPAQEPRGQPHRAEPNGETEDSSPIRSQANTRYQRYTAEARKFCDCIWRGIGWLWQHRPKSTAERWLALGTWALAVVAYLALDDSRRALEKSQRAWVGPRAIEMLVRPVIDKGMSIKIRYENSGREPALDTSIMHMFSVFSEKQWEDMSSFDLVKMYGRSCMDITSSPERNIFPIYPGTGHDYSMSLNTNDEKELTRIVADTALVNGDTVLAIHGCIIYKTTGNSNLRHSAICNYYWAKAIDTFPILPICSVGNYAD